MAQAPIDKFFNSVGKGTILSKPPPKAKPAKAAPMRGPYTKGYKAPKPTPAPKQKPWKPPAQKPQGILGPGSILGPTPKQPAWAKEPKPVKTPKGASPWPAPYLKPSLQTKAAQAHLQAHPGDTQGAIKAGRREIRVAGQHERVRQYYQHLYSGGTPFGVIARPVEALGKGAWSETKAALANVLMAAHQGRGPTPLHTPVAPVLRSSALRAVQPAAGVSRAAIELGFGSNIAHAIGQKAYNPYGFGAEAALSLIPLKGVTKTSRAIEEAGLLGERTLPKVLTGLGERSIPVGHDITLTARRSPNLIPRLLENAKDAQLRKVIEANKTLGLGRELERPGFRDAPVRSLGARLAQRHVKNLMRTAKFYGDTFDKAEMEALLNTKLKPREYLALRSVAQNVMPHTTIANNENLIAKARATIDRIPGLRDKAGGDAKKLAKLATTERQARRTVENLTRENVLLGDVGHYVEHVPNAEIDRTRYPTHPEFTGAKVQLRSGTGRQGALNDVWDSLVRVGHQSEEIGLREAEAAAKEKGGTPEQIAQRVEQVRQQFENRLHQPGQIAIHGAKWRPGEDILLTRQHRAIRDAVIAKQAEFDKSLAQDQARVAKGSVPKQSVGFEGAMSKKTRDLRGELNQLENRLARHEGRATKRLGFDATSLYGKKSGLVGGEDWKGGTLYYPSKTEAALTGAAKTYRSRAGDILPYGPRAEPQHAFTGALMETGGESPKITQLVARKALARSGREKAMAELEPLRGAAVRGAPPLDPRTGLPSDQYVPIRLSKTIPADKRHEWESVMATLSSPHELSDDEAAAVASNLHDMVRYHMPDPKLLHDPKSFGYVHKALANSMRDMRTINPDEVKTLTRAMQNMSQAARDIMIYSKLPGHIPPRLASNMIMGMSDHPVLFFRGLGMAPRLYRQDKNLATWIHHLMGSGSTRAYVEAGRGVNKGFRAASHLLVKPIEVSADRGPRIATFLAYAMHESGARNYDELVRYLKQMRDAKPGDKLFTSRRMLLEDARKTAGEYENLGPIEKKLSSFVFLYRWLRASAMWTARTVARHPIASAAAGYGTYRYAYNPNNPIWNRFNVAGHNIQTALPFSTPVENLTQVANLLTSTKPPALGESVGDLLNPAIATGLSALYHRDIATGRDIKGNAILGALESFGRSTPIGSLAAGKGSRAYRWEKFLGGNWLPISGAAGPVSSGGTFTPATPIATAPSGGAGTLSRAQQKAILSTARGSITPAQQKAILGALKAGERALKRRRR